MLTRTLGIAALVAALAAPAHAATRHPKPTRCGRWLIARALATRDQPEAALAIPGGCEQMTIPAPYDVRQGALGQEIWRDETRLAVLPHPAPAPAPVAARPVPVTIIDKRPLREHRAFRGGFLFVELTREALVEGEGGGGR